MELPDYNKISFPESSPIPWRTVLPDASPLATDLLGKLLQYDPHNRISAQEVVLLSRMILFRGT